MTDPINIIVGLKDTAYSILIKPNLLDESKEIWFGHPTGVFDWIKNRKIFVITDRNVMKAGHLATLMKALVGKNVGDPIIMAPGEETKSFTGLELLTRKLLMQGVDRDSILIALGGGVIGDLVGFASSIILRGIDYIQIPTTLLAQVDSSVGGKTAINTEFGKNLIGAFKQPKMVLIDPSVLQTLPAREMRSGYAELIKYGLITNQTDICEFFDLFEFLDQNDKAEGIFAHDQEILCLAIEKACRAKAFFVQRDEKEQSVRALLNLGHTFGHALEAYGNFSESTHGEGVSVGIVLAFALSFQLKLCSEDDLIKVVKHLRRLGMPTRIEDLFDLGWRGVRGVHPDIIKEFIDGMCHSMQHDKKMSNGKLNFILVNGIGSAFVGNNIDVSMDLVKKVIRNG